MNSKKRNQGFTVLHLAIIIAILAIFAAIFCPTYLKSNKALIGSKIIADMKNIENGAIEYYIKYGDYPDSYTPSLEGESLTENQKKFIELIDGKKWPMPALGEFIIEKTVHHKVIKGKTTRLTFYKYNHNSSTFNEKNGILINNVIGPDGKEVNLHLVELLQ